MLELVTVGSVLLDNGPVAAWSMLELFAVAGACCEGVVDAKYD